MTERPWMFYIHKPVQSAPTLNNRRRIVHTLPNTSPHSTLIIPSSFLPSFSPLCWGWELCCLLPDSP
jgi:hypothetical protein